MEVYTSAPPFLPPGTEAGNIGPLRCCLLHEVGGGTKKRPRGGDMPNEQNLIPMDQRSQSEARELGREGGRASGASRRRKRSLREAADLYLSLPVADKRAWNKLARDGVEPEDVDNQMAVIAGLTLKAAKGDAKAAKVLFDLLGEQGAAGAGGMQDMDDDPITASLKEEMGNGLLLKAEGDSAFPIPGL